MLSIDALLAFATADSYNCTLLLMLAVFVLVFVASHINNNYSWVDRSWSIVPVVYTWMHVAFAVRDSRAAVPLVNNATVFAALITAWGVRLTFNFARRGGYRRGGEDYRWNDVHTWPFFVRFPLLWPVFNFFVISLFQTWLLWAITLPVLSLPPTAPTAHTALTATTFAALLVFETTCDNQQWHFHQLKHSGRAAERFCITGVFGYSRHLNVFCEGMMWVTLAVAGCLHAGARLPAWQLAGAVVLQLLTWFSTACITERLTRDKYPEYAIYQQTTPMLVPALTSTTRRTRYLLARHQGRDQE